MMDEVSFLSSKLPNDVELVSLEETTPPIPLVDLIPVDESWKRAEDDWYRERSRENTVNSIVPNPSLPKRWKKSSKCY